MKCSFIVLLLLSSFSAYSTEQVFIEGDEYGQGFVIKHLSKCFFVAPSHVVENSLFLNLLGSNKQRSVGEGQVIQIFGYDLSVGSVEGKLAQDCNTSFNSLKSNTKAIESNNSLVISTVNSDGLKSRQSVIAAETTLTNIYVQPSSEEQNLYKGMSGSLVYAGNTPIGMLQSIDSQTGLGQVLRFDRLLETISPFFISVITQPSPQSGLTESSADLVSYELTEWTHTSASSASSVKAVGDGDNNTAWEVVLNGEFLEITLSLANSKEISGLTLVSDSNGKSTVKSFEVLVSKKSSGKRGWLSKSSLSTFPQTTENKMTWLPLYAKRVKIRIFNSWEPSSLVHINEIVVH